MTKKENGNRDRVLVPKRITTTRWSCRADAIKALLRGYTEIKNALFEISEDEEQHNKSRITALGLYNQMLTMETGLYTVFWVDILGQVNNTSETLQNPRLDVNTAASTLASLKRFIQSKRDCFKDYEEKAHKSTNCTEYEINTKRKRKTNVRLAPLDCAQAPEIELGPSDTFRTQSFIPVIDNLDTELRKRLEAYKLVYERFGFLNNLDKLSDEEMLAASKKLLQIYRNDLDDNLGNELIQFKHFSMQFNEEYERKKETISRERWMYQLLFDYNLKNCFPNLEITLRMYLSLMITNSSAERSFSKLKLIKNRLRTSMTEDRLNFLSLLSIENDVLKQVKHEDIIKEFIEKKIRRKPI